VSSTDDDLRIERLDSERGFRLRGAIDVVTVKALREALDTELHGTVVLDVAGVDYVSDDGLGLLVWAIKRLRPENGSLILRNPQGPIRRVLEMTGLSKVPGLTVQLDVGNSAD
jgi:anti-sigma B factor antagonist